MKRLHFFFLFAAVLGMASCNDKPSPYTEGTSSNPTQINYVNPNNLSRAYKMVFNSSDTANWPRDVAGTIRAYFQDGTYFLDGRSSLFSISDYTRDTFETPVYWHRDFQIDVEYQVEDLSSAREIGFRFNSNGAGSEYFSLLGAYHDGDIVLQRRFFDDGVFITNNILEQNLPSLFTYDIKKLTVRKVNNYLYVFVDDKYIGRTVFEELPNGDRVGFSFASNTQAYVTSFEINYIVGK